MILCCFVVDFFGAHSQQHLVQAAFCSFQAFGRNMPSTYRIRYIVDDLGEPWEVVDPPDECDAASQEMMDLYADSQVSSGWMSMAYRVFPRMMAAERCFGMEKPDVSHDEKSDAAPSKNDDEKSDAASSKHEAGVLVMAESGASSRTRSRSRGRHAD